MFITAFFVGCNKDDSVVNNTETAGLSATEDAAESVASAVGEDNGGVVDQVGDLLESAQTEGFSALSKSSGTESKEAVYDSINGIWTITLFRERGNPAGPYYAKFERIYNVQLLNQDGNPQKHYITNGDTAYTITFDIVSGTGYHKTRRLTHELKDLAGSLVATNTNTRLVTVNGTYSRAATDTVTTKNAERTLDYKLDLVLTDVTGPRGSRRDLSKKISGEITGNYSAFVTFTRGDAYLEKEIERSIHIVFGGDGNANIAVNGEKFSGDVASGELVSN